MTITNKGAPLQNHPVQIGRPFLEGSIRGAPQVLLDGAPIPTQANVQNRYDDGSVKFAVLSFVVPKLDGSASVEFRDRQQAPATVPALPADIRAAISLTVNGATKAASASAMLAAGHYQVWTEGPIATTLILADHIGRTYDIGFDAFRPLRPIFHVTVWHTIGKVRVRFIGELANTEDLGGMTADVELTINDQSVYKRAALPMLAMSRWSKVFWIGGAPEPRVNIDHDLAHLARTRFIPNFDASIKIPESSLAAQYAKWQAAKKDLYDAGLWMKGMGTTGGRPDIGPYPSWMTYWAYTGDWRAQEMALEQADLAGAWPLHLREGNPAKFLDRGKAVPGLGRVCSISTRPTSYLAGNGGPTYAETKPEDRMRVTGPLATNGWSPDLSHQPDPYSIPYVLTGDFWYLEQMQLWAAHSAHASSGAHRTVSYGRGPTGAEGGIGSQVRGEAWTIRSRAQAAFLSPDGDPERDYFWQLTLDALANWEGQRDIRGTQFEGAPIWTWARKLSQTASAVSRWFVGGKLLGPPPLGWWENNTALVMFADLNTGTNDIPVGGATSNWMQNYLIYSLGRVRELGFPADALLASVGGNLVAQLTDSAFSPYLVAAYHSPVMKADGAYFANWDETRRGFPKVMQIATDWQASQSASPESYLAIALCASSMVTHLPNGENARQVLVKLIGDSLKIMSTDPRYAILPRVAPAPELPVSRTILIELDGAVITVAVKPGATCTITEKP